MENIKVITRKVSYKSGGWKLRAAFTLLHFVLLKDLLTRYRIRKASGDLWGRGYEVKKNRQLPEEKLPKLSEMVVKYLRRILNQEKEHV